MGTSNIDKVTGAAKNFICELYRTGEAIYIPGFSEIQKFWWDGFCGTNSSPDAPALPPPNSPPFQGGQCVCTLYRVYFSYLSNVYQPGTRQLGNNVCFGAIEGITIEQSQATRTFTIYLVGRGAPPQVCGQPGTKSVAKSGGLFNGEVYSDLRIDSVAVEGSGANNCGNPPIKYPNSPSPPPGGYTSPPVSITFNDNSQHTYYFNYEPPALPPVPTNFMPPVVLNWFDFKLNPSFKIPITFDFDGTINFGGGGGDINFDQDDRDNINNIKNITNNNGDKIINLTNEINNITNNNNNKPPEPDDFDPPEEDIPPGEHDQSYLAFVQIDLTEVPKNAKTQAGNTADDILYAGWFEWRRVGYNAPREPIHFKKSVFVAPKGIDGFAYTLYNGYKGIAKAYSNKEKT